MKLKDLLKEKRSNILKKWTDLILDTYPSESAMFFKNQENKFSNPVGSIIVQGAGDILDEIFQESNSDNMSRFLTILSG